VQMQTASEGLQALFARFSRTMPWAHGGRPRIAAGITGTSGTGDEVAMADLVVEVPPVMEDNPEDLPVVEDTGVVTVT
jgi:hypothetical protein